MSKIQELGFSYLLTAEHCLMIPLTLSKTVPVNLALYDITGKVVKVIENGIKPAGDYRITVDCRNLSSGIYFLMTTIMNQNSAKKIVLIK